LRGIEHVATRAKHGERGVLVGCLLEIMREVLERRWVGDGRRELERHVGGQVERVAQFHQSCVSLADRRSFLRLDERQVELGSGWFEIGGCPGRDAVLRRGKDTLRDLHRRPRLGDAKLGDLRANIGGERAKPRLLSIQHEIGARDARFSFGLVHPSGRCAPDVEEKIEHGAVPDVAVPSAGQGRARVDRQPRVDGHHDAGAHAARFDLTNGLSGEDDFRRLGRRSVQSFGQ